MLYTLPSSRWNRNYHSPQTKIFEKWISRFLNRLTFPLEKIQWSMRVIVAIIALFVIVFLNLFALEGSPKIPFVHDYHKVMTAEKPLMRNNETAKEYRSFRRFFHEKKMHNAYADASARKTHFTGNGSLLTEKYL